MDQKTRDMLDLARQELAAKMRPGRRPVLVQCDDCGKVVLGVREFTINHRPNCQARKPKLPIPGGKRLTREQLKAILGPIT